jgi:hypothetical protein
VGMGGVGRVGGGTPEVGVWNQKGATPVKPGSSPAKGENTLCSLWFGATATGA